MLSHMTNELKTKPKVNKTSAVLILFEIAVVFFPSVKLLTMCIPI